MALGKKPLISEADQTLIAQAIIDLERSSSGEIVPMLVAKSSEYVYFRSLFSFIISLPISLLIFSKLHFLVLTDLLFLTIILYFIFFYFFGFHFFLKFIIPKKVKIHKCKKQANFEFFNNGIYKTRDKTGIFIYISLLEKQVVVYGDEGINAKIKEDEWQNLVDIIIKSIKNKNITQGIIDGLKASNELLKQKFPIKTDDTNELPNKLILK